MPTLAELLATAIAPAQPAPPPQPQGYSHLPSWMTGLLPTPESEAARVNTPRFLNKYEGGGFPEMLRGMDRLRR